MCVRGLDRSPSEENLKANSRGVRVRYQQWNRNSATRGETAGEEQAPAVTEQGLTKGSSARLFG
jgi:hypothetical protein